MTRVENVSSCAFTSTSTSACASRSFSGVVPRRGLPSVDLFTLHWTVVHPITADSPLRGATPESVRAAQAELLVLVNAHEETFSTRVTARASYWWDEIRWDVKFASVFASTTDGAIAIDVERLDRLERLEPGTTSKPPAQELPAEGTAAAS